MEQWMMILFMAVLGLLLGSFAAATVWRLRARQLQEDKADGEKVPANELKKISKLKKKSVASDRSVCLHCGHQLAWYDLVPLVSWVQLRGRCRYCRQPIGWFEPASELLMAAFFALSYSFWPWPLTNATAVAYFGLWLLAGIGLLILFWYDAHWYLLPDRVMLPVIVVALLAALVRIGTTPHPFEAAGATLLSVGILGGLYFVLYVASKGAWIGFGDVKLGVALGLLLVGWQQAFLALFLANAIGCLIVLPTMAAKKLTRTSRIPFGPMLIAGWFIAGIWGSAITSWYTSLVYVL